MGRKASDGPIVALDAVVVVEGANDVKAGPSRKHYTTTLVPFSA